ncbi:MAG: hypothetical protein QOH61_216 [Chloroflexota bacterium]|jgi:hypothetical protein|nr:hypothetical protein [Chloroflexota bacterium]
MAPSRRGLGGPRATRRITTATGIAVVASLAIASSGLAMNFGPAVVLYSGGGHSWPTVDDIAAKGPVVAVAWTRQLFEQPTFLRWSRDGGATFAPKVTLDDRTGAAIDTCAGSVWAVTQDGIDGIAHLDGWRLDGAAHSHWPLAAGSHGGDVACVGNRALATAWERNVNGAVRVKLQVRTITSGNLSPATTFDLGTTNRPDELSVAATNHDIQVTWMKGRKLQLKRFDVGPGADPEVTPLPTQTVTTFVTDQAGSPLVAADASRVVLAYKYREDARVRVSENGGASFGTFHTLVDNTTGDVFIARPYSLDAFGGRIAANAESAGGDSALTQLFVSQDGVAWSKASQSPGWQAAALFGTAASPRIGEAWDNYFHYPRPDHGKIRFHEGPA